MFDAAEIKRMIKVNYDDLYTLNRWYDPQVQDLSLKYKNNSIPQVVRRRRSRCSRIPPYKRTSADDNITNVDIGSTQKHWKKLMLAAEGEIRHWKKEMLDYSLQTDVYIRNETSDITATSETSSNDTYNMSGPSFTHQDDDTFNMPGPSYTHQGDDTFNMPGSSFTHQGDDTFNMPGPSFTHLVDDTSNLPGASFTHLDLSTFNKTTATDIIEGVNNLYISRNEQTNTVDQESIVCEPRSKPKPTRKKKLPPTEAIKNHIYVGKTVDNQKDKNCGFKRTMKRKATNDVPDIKANSKEARLHVQDAVDATESGSSQVENILDMKAKATNDVPDIKANSKEARVHVQDAVGATENGSIKVENILDMKHKTCDAHGKIKKEGTLIQKTIKKVTSKHRTEPSKKLNLPRNEKTYNWFQSWNSNDVRKPDWKLQGFFMDRSVDNRTTDAEADEIDILINKIQQLNVKGK